MSAPLCSSSVLIRSQFVRTSSTLSARGVSEDMGMAADHLLGDLPEDVGDVEFTRLFGHPGEEEDLEEEIAELLPELPGRSPVKRLEDLVGLFDEVAGRCPPASGSGPRGSRRAISAGR